MKDLWQAGARRSQRSRWLVAGIGVGALLVIAIASTRGGEPQGPQFGEGPDLDSAALLAGARAAAPFKLRYPAIVPAGLTLLNVQWGGPDPVEYPGSTDFSADYWFLDPDGIRLHVWQTNVKGLGAEDPTRNSNAVGELIGDDSWLYLAPSGDAYHVYQLSRRFPDGVLVSVDYYADTPILREVAQALGAGE